METGTARIGVDVGGTFTDVTLRTGDGLVTAKVATTPEQADGVMRGIEVACERGGIVPAGIGEFTHATTVPVNALLERAGAQTALVTTEGFRDVVEIGRQDRPDLYDRSVERPDPLIPRRRRLEVDERATPEGVERPVTEEAIERVAGEIRETGAESIAVALLHAYATPDNEARLAEGLRDRLPIPVSVSHEVLAAFREYERTATTAADAYVRPAVDAYLGDLIEQVRAAGVPTPQVMGGNGGVAGADRARERAATTVLSGPAAGVVGAARAAEGVAADRDLAGLVTFDMGGTSSDVSLVRDGEAERTAETTVGGVPIHLPMVDVTTVGSGGGSVARVDSGGALRVGPRSAGAEPGPACYGRGGEEPTVTDAAVELGYAGGKLGGELALEPDRATAVLAELAEAGGFDTAAEAAAGIYRVAAATMTRTIREVTVEAGHDPREFGLVAFGGAGPLFGAALADRLGIGTVVVPLQAGVLSAMGLLAADEEVDAVRTLRTRLAEADLEAVEAAFAAVGERARKGLRDPDRGTVDRVADCRYAGQSFELSVPAPDPFDPEIVRDRFEDAHERAYGYRTDDPVELVTLRARASVGRELGPIPYEGEESFERGTRKARFGDDVHETAVHDRRGPPIGTTIDGPAVLEGRESTTLVPPEWTATVRGDGTLVLTEGGESA
ncbi:hydantoinase/oxoprolinase family protein [Saliphagus sp. LR7]|uniref:hydantoinase/oxoprolinase family protein n=1 Tax=Saliphagus sp. LR7 TaxID=2282654 RepID=UPI000DF7290E|nr:hydantoinase/oxoprolinase family protein [Saliphagus sp. LR7]